MAETKGKQANKSLYGAKAGWDVTPMAEMKGSQGYRHLHGAEAGYDVTTVAETNSRLATAVAMTKGKQANGLCMKLTLAEM